MEALVWEGPNELNLRIVDRPRPQTGQVAIRVAAVGVCGSEIEGYLGRMGNRTPPLVMGHEASGVVATVGTDVDRGRVGERVYINPVVACGRCDQCVEGAVNLCPSKSLIGISLPGAFAEIVVVPAENAIRIGDGLSHQAASLAEPLANVIHAFDRVGQHTPVRRVLVIGAGAIGLLAAQVARRLGADHVVITDLNEERLGVGQRLGVDAAITPEAVAATVASLPMRGFDVVFDAVGAGSTREMGVLSARSGGTVILLGLHDDRSELPFHLAIRKEIRLVPSFLYLPRDTSRALRWLALGWVEHVSWVTQLPMSDGPRVFEDLAAGTSHFSKVILAPGGA
jgi:2-desacetyl-2-hydroxyethyl bacteriochlorophyllide A dehydrogenase